MIDRTPFELMPVDGPRDPRSTSRVINQAMGGKLNSVVDFTIPIGGLPYVLKDLRISPQSYVDLMPTNAEAWVSNVFWFPGDGVLNIREPDPEYQNAIAQVEQSGGAVTFDPVIWTTIPYDTTTYDLNWTVHPGDAGSVDNRIISLITGNVMGWFTINGNAGGNNPSLDIGLAHRNSSDALLERVDISFVGSGTATVFNMSANFMFANDVAPGDYFEMEGRGDQSLSVYNSVWGLESKTGLDSARINDTDALEYRAVIIG